MEQKIQIAVDGPAGAGKSTIAKMISSELGITYLDTGAMYRAVALKVNREGIKMSDTVNIAKIVSDIDIDIKNEGGIRRIYLDGEDVSEKIRTNEISMGASAVAVIPEVRIKLVALQREIAEAQSVVMDGRDIGTHVLPNARLKIFLTATPEKRAERRHAEMLAKGDDSMTLSQVFEDIKKRDLNDSTREFSPLKKAEGAIEIDSSELSIDEVVDWVKSFLGRVKNV